MKTDWRPVGLMRRVSEGRHRGEANVRKDAR